MDKSILMHTYIHESTELSEICYNTRKNHARYEVLWSMYVRIKLEGLNLRTRVTSGLLQLIHDIRKGRDAHFLSNILLYVDSLALLGRRHQFFYCTAAILCHFLYNGIALRVDGTSVERVLGIVDAKESGTLLIGGRSETRHFLQLGARSECSVLLAIIHDVLCKGRAESADVCQKVDTCCVEVNAY